MEKRPNELDSKVVNTKKASWKASLLRGILVVLAIVIFAYGFRVTKVSFEQINSPTRQESLTRVLRAIARPDIIAYEQIETNIETGIFIPCQDGASNPASASTDEPYLVLSPSCAEPRAEITVEGFNFRPNDSGPVYFIPPSEVQLNMGRFNSDGQGYFTLDIKLPARPDTQMQKIRAITSVNVGSPYFTETAHQTWNKIVETVFLALLATAFGIIIAVPVSFFAAQNLMRDITAPMSSLALSIVGWPVGVFLGTSATRWIRTQSQMLTVSPALTLIGTAVTILVLWLFARWAFPSEEDERKPGLGKRLARLASLLVFAAAAILLLYLIASLAQVSGEFLEANLGAFGFLGSFLRNLGEILNLLVILFAAVAGGAAASGVLARLGTMIYMSLPRPWVFLANMLFGALAGAVIALIMAAGLDWLYRFSNSVRVFTIFALVGAALGVLTAVLTRKRDAIPVGIVIYTITRTVMNVLRAIEALIWVIIFVVWVGIGPFAGVLALTLHTIAALGKLYSEQVESILPGPLEAVKATGATRIQTIVYAVIPQIIPPYISFTIYRWDINVRMSTIIGFAGGGGIGFLLFQNINLLNYRGASAQMLSIAVVVALMDYFSAWLRNKVV